MRQLRGFTLIEVMVCLTIITILFVPFTKMTERLTAAYHRSIHKLEDRNEFESLAYRLQAVLRAHPDYKITAGNKGATWSGGSIQWEGSKISVILPQGQQVLGKDISHFSLHRREGKTYITLVQGKTNSATQILMQVEDQDA